MSDIEEPTSPVRKTRSGRAVKTPAKPRATPRATGRKTRKKAAVMEVEASDEDIENTEQPKQKKAKLDDEDKLLESDNEDADQIVEETLLNSADEEDKLHNVSGELILNDVSMLEDSQDVQTEVQLETVQTEVENDDNVSKDGFEYQPAQEVSDDTSTFENGVHQQEEELEEASISEDVSQNITEVTTEPEKEDIISGSAVTLEPEPEKEKGPEPAVATELQQEGIDAEDAVPTQSENKEVTSDSAVADELKHEESEELPKAASPKVQNGEPEAENISDDELPAVPVAKVPETEEVSDDELPGPKRAELPADTEVVSEDELPAPPKKETDEEETKKEVGKRKLSESGYDPTSPTSEGETPLKKVKEEKEEKEADAAKAAKPKKLPELDKYWKAVNDDPTDFTGWTYLLQYVDQENDMEAAREAYDAFLSHYPYCYGYWRKYADYEKRKGNKKKCEEVFERGLKAIPLSVDLWIHYLTYVKSAKGEDEEYVRSQFERAINACGLEFRSDRLWDSYIKWEGDAKRLQKVTAIYDRLLTTPTQCYTTHFDNFQEHVSAHAPNKILDVDEFMALRKEVRAMLKSEEKAADNADLPPGDEDSKLYTTEEETKCIRERIVSIRRKIHKNTVNAVTARWNFEEGIKRPYFHVKPLERCQLKNWHDYLDYEIEQGDRVRIIVLFERCLIACALYEEFWLKFVSYLENLKDAEFQPKIRDVYERACTIHHLKKPSLHLQWAVFEETVGSINRAAEILVNLEKQVPNVLQVAYRRINLERRRGDFEKCQQLFEHYVNNSKNKIISSNISIKYSRFCLRVLNDFNKAHEILKSAITKDPHNPRVYLQLVDLILQKNDVQEEDVCAVFDEFLEKEGADPDQKALFAQRKVEYLEDFGSCVQSLQAAHEQYQKFHKLCKESSKKKDGKTESGSSSSSKKEKPSSSSASQSQSYGNYNYGTSSNQPPYNYSGAQQGQYNYPQYGQGDQYQYQNWQYPQGGAYGGYNQWSGYTGGYGY